jgi:hypothetical protein
VCVFVCMCVCVCVCAYVVCVCVCVCVVDTNLCLRVARQRRDFTSHSFAHPSYTHSTYGCMQGMCVYEWRRKGEVVMR